MLFTLILAPASRADEIVLGWIGPLIGNSAVVGTDSLHAVELAVKEVNTRGGIGGKYVRLIAEDDSYNTERSLNAYSKMVGTDRPLAVFMQTYGAVFALGSRPDKDGVIVFDVLDCNEDIAALPAGIFCLATMTESVAEGFTADILKRGSGRVLILYEENDPWMAFIEKTARSELLKKGVDVLSESSLATSADYRSTLIKAKSKGIDAAIFLGNDQMGLALKQARDMGIKAQFYSIGSMTSPGFQALSGAASEGTLVSFWEAAGSKKYEGFLRDFIDQFRKPPVLQLAAVPAYDAAVIVMKTAQDVIKRGMILDAQSLRKALLAVENFPGVSGPITIESDGAVRTIKERLYLFRNGALQTP